MVAPGLNETIAAQKVDLARRKRLLQLFTDKDVQLLIETAGDVVWQVSEPARNDVLRYIAPKDGMGGGVGSSGGAVFECGVHVKKGTTTAIFGPVGSGKKRPAQISIPKMRGTGKPSNIGRLEIHALDRAGTNGLCVMGLASKDGPTGKQLKKGERKVVFRCVIDKKDDVNGTDLKIEGTLDKAKISSSDSPVRGYQISQHANDVEDDDNCMSGSDRYFKADSGGGGTGLIFSVHPDFTPPKGELPWDLNAIETLEISIKTNEDKLLANPDEATAAEGESCSIKKCGSLLKCDETTKLCVDNVVNPASPPKDKPPKDPPNSPASPKEKSVLEVIKETFEENLLYWIIGGIALFVLVVGGKIASVVIERKRQMLEAAM